ncbi:MAG: hypothetical protein MUP22_04390 [Desulfobacterales bacterium]|nr:hypothetical protein [Desulfobacterales bacterium]
MKNKHLLKRKSLDSKRIVIIVLLIFISGCLSPLKQIKDSAKPFERESCSLLPPSGSGWRYIEEDQDSGYALHFSRQGISPTHTVSAIFFEFQANTTFGSPEHFLNYIRQMKESDIDPWRHKLIEKKWVLDGRFGDYSVHYYTVVEDYDPYSTNPNEYNISKLYGYVILHPYIDNIIIDILFTEQGNPAEVNPQFQKEALKFIEGLHLKKSE